MKRNILKLATAALMCAAVAGCCKEATEEPDYGTGRAEAVLAEAAETNIMQIPSNMETAMTLTVELNKPVNRDVRFNLFPAADLVDNYNFQQAAEYNSLPAHYFQLGTNIDFPQGATSGSTTLVLPNGLPDDGEPYALGIRLSAAYVDYTSINTEQNSILYIFYREGEEAPDPTLPPVVSLTGSNEPTLVDGENPVTVSFTVSLSKSFSEEVTVDLAIDSSAENSLTEQYLTWSEHSVTFAPFELTKTVNLTVNSLPDYDAEANDYEKGPDQTLRIVLTGATPAEVGLSTVNNAAEYTFTYPVPQRPFTKTEAVQGNVQFSGTSARQSVTLNLTLEKWTIEAWIKYNETTSTYKSAEWTGNSSNSTTRRKWVYSPTSYPFTLPGINFVVYPLGNSAHAPNMTIGDWVSMPYGAKTKDGFCWSPDEWTHLAFVYDGSELKFYINGQPGEYADNAQDNTTTAVPNSMGYSKAFSGTTDWTTLALAYSGTTNNSTFASHYGLGMAQLRLWGVARTAEQIKDDMAYNINPQSEGLEAYWPMDEGSGTTLKDITEHGHDITFTSSGSWVSTQTSFSKEGTRQAGQAY